MLIAERRHYMAGMVATPSPTPVAATPRPDAIDDIAGFARRQPPAFAPD